MIADANHSKLFEKLTEDIKRLDNEGEFSFRTLLRGLFSQGFQAVVVYRFFHWLDENNIPGQPLRFFSERFIEITTGISIPAVCKIGKGFRIHHFGGIILHPSVVIGNNCTMYQNVTIGDLGGYGGVATIGDNVIIGAGAKIIGNVVLGDFCKIGANCVVNRDVPAYGVALGNPMVLKSSFAKSKSKSISE